MASKSTISIGFKQEDAEGGFKKLTLDADALRQVMNANVTEAEKSSDFGAKKQETLTPSIRTFCINRVYAQREH